MTKFEYCYSEAKNHKLLIDEANVLGNEGWEMVDLEHNLNNFAVALFKREKVPLAVNQNTPNTEVTLAPLTYQPTLPKGAS